MTSKRTEVRVSRSIPPHLCLGCFAHSRGGYYHDGRFSTLDDVFEHYNSTKHLGPSPS